MRKRIVQPRTAVDSNTPNDIQDYFENNFEIVNRDLLGISSGLTESNQIQVLSGLDLRLLEGAISNGDGNFWETINGNIDFTAPSTDNSYIIYASGGVLQDDPYDGKILIDTATRQTQIQTINRLSYNSFVPVILLASDTPPTDYIQLATFDVTGTGTTISNLVLNYSDFGNLAVNSLQAFSQSGKSEAFRTNQVTGQIIEETGNTKWLKIDIDALNNATGIEINNNSLTGKGIVLNNNIGLEANGSQILVNKTADYESIKVISSGGSIITNNPSYISQFNDGNIGIGYLFNDLSTTTDSGDLRYGAFFTNTGGGTYDKGIILDNYNTGIQAINNASKTAFQVVGSNDSDTALRIDDSQDGIVINCDGDSQGFRITKEGGTDKLINYAGIMDLYDGSSGLLFINNSSTNDDIAGIFFESGSNNYEYLIKGEGSYTNGIVLEGIGNSAIQINDTSISGARDGIEINGTTRLIGVNIQTCDIGLSVNNADRDSVQISNSGRYGIDINNTSDSSVRIVNSIGSNAGIEINGTTSNIAIDINQCDFGLTITDADRDGVQITNSGRNGIQINNSTEDAIEINNANKGIIISGTTAEAIDITITGNINGIEITDTDNSGNTSAGIVVTNAQVGFKSDIEYNRSGGGTAFSGFGLGTYNSSSAVVNGCVMQNFNYGYYSNNTNIALFMENYNQALIRPSILTESDMNTLYSTAQNGDIVVYYDSGSSNVNNTLPALITAGVKIAMYDDTDTTNVWQIMNP